MRVRVPPAALVADETLNHDHLGHDGVIDGDELLSRNLDAERGADLDIEPKAVWMRGYRLIEDAEEPGLLASSGTFSLPVLHIAIIKRGIELFP